MTNCARAALLCAALIPLPASAQNAIGEMAQIQGQVTAAFRGAVSPLSNGTSVVQNHTISTAASSSGRVAFHDLTSLAIGPGASVTLDRYVYNPDGTIGASSVKLARGAFRLVSGRSPSQNLGVSTPTATIGLRGTVVDVLVRPGRELVVLKEGAARVCRAAQCVGIDQPGLGVYVTADGVSNPSTGPAAEFDFDVLTINRFALYRPYGGLPGGESRETPSSQSRSSSSQGATAGGQDAGQ